MDLTPHANYPSTYKITAHPEACFMSRTVKDPQSITKLATQLDLFQL